MIQNKYYFVAPINSSKANKFTEIYHYSGVGFKQAKVNLGIFNKNTNQLVGVLQWGNSYQDKIRLDRYVSNLINKEEYLELNRFCMANSEGKNAESLAISLGIKWIKKNMPNIKLLVSYAGRKEGNYGYIYQATNWEYLGYFISEGFWFVDGEERHLATLWYRYTHHLDQSLGFIDALKKEYADVRKTWTKQFIYIIRLDKMLKLASPILPYPKPANEYPIKTKEVIYQENNEKFNNYIKPQKEEKIFYYNPKEQLFSNRVLIKRGEKEKGTPHNATPIRPIAVYDIGGNLEIIFSDINSIPTETNYLRAGVLSSIKNQNTYKNKYFRFFDDDEAPQTIEVPIICYIDEIAFNSFAEIGRYLGVSRQAVQQSSKRKSKQINGKDILWEL